MDKIKKGGVAIIISVGKVKPDMKKKGTYKKKSKTVKRKHKSYHD